MDPTPPSEQPEVPPPMPVMPSQTERSNGIAIASLVCGIVGVMLFFTIFVPIILGILAVIFGAIGIGNANKGAGNKGLAIAGLVCGVVAIAAMIAFVSIFATTTVHIINSYTPSLSPQP